MLSKLALLAVVPFVAAEPEAGVAFRASGAGGKALTDRALTAEEQKIVTDAQTILGSLLYDMDVTVATLKAIGYSGADEVVVGEVSGEVVTAASIQGDSVTATGAVTAASVSTAAVTVNGASAVAGASTTGTLRVAGQADFRADVEVNGNLLANGLLWAPQVFANNIVADSSAVLGAAAIGAGFLSGISLEVFGNYAKSSGNAVVVYGNVAVSDGVTAQGEVHAEGNAHGNNLVADNQLTVAHNAYFHGEVHVWSNVHIATDEDETDDFHYLTLNWAGIRFDWDDRRPTNLGSDKIHDYAPTFRADPQTKLLFGVDFSTSNTEEGVVATVINSGAYGVAFGESVGSDGVDDMPYSLNENSTGIDNEFENALFVMTAYSAVDIIYFDGDWYCKGCTITAQVPESWDVATLTMKNAFAKTNAFTGLPLIGGVAGR